MQLYMSWVLLFKVVLFNLKWLAYADQSIVSVKIIIRFTN